jgi:RNA polymerase sigma-70 factor (ECF subfamily)
MGSLSLAAHFRAGALVAMVRPRAVTPDLSLDQAMDLYAQGEGSAFAVVYAGLELKLRPFLMRLAGRSPLADDLLQETFMRIHRARGSFEPGARVVPWAYAIARNAWLDHVRLAQVRGQVDKTTLGSPRRGKLDHAATDDASPIEPATGPEADSEQAAIARQTAVIVEKALAALPSAQREAFVLLRYEGLSVQEAAEILGSTPTAVKLRAFRAYESLREALGQSRKGKGGEGGV